MFGKKDKNLTVEAANALLERVVDPELEKSIVAAGFVKEVQVEPERVRVHLELPTPAWEPRELLAQEVLRTVGAEDRKVELSFGAAVKPSRPSAAGNNLIPAAKNIILFASGKGGVGKSTVATNVAAALARLGASVGLLDADIYGPSIPTMLGTHQRPEVAAQKLIPVERHGMKVMSIGFIVDPKEAMSWRGPMLNGALIQFMRDVEWGDLDYMILDLPPGTGDVQLTIAQNLKVSGAVLVSTPQQVALADVLRGKAMFDRVDIPTLGVIENMAYFLCGRCQEKHHIFAAGGASRLANELRVPLLGEIPLEVGTRESADLGKPEVLAHPDSSASAAFNQVAKRIATLLARQAINAGAGPRPSLRILQ